MTSISQRTAGHFPFHEDLPQSRFQRAQQLLGAKCAGANALSGRR
jgi:hypothetical protein